MGKIKVIMSNPKLYMIYALGRIMRGSVSADRTYLKILYKNRVGKELHLDPPKTFNEKIQWLKLYDRKPEYAMMVDKYKVKQYVVTKIGEEHIIPTLGVWDRFDEIDFDSLPEQFVLKCTHDSGGLVIVKDKKSFDKKSARKKINHCLKRNYFWNTREWPYKSVKPRIIAEKFMVDESGVELKDYKFFTFNGEPKALFVATDRGTDTRFDFYDIYFNHLPFLNGHPSAVKEIDRPAGFEQMKQLARKLSEGIPHLRVDFYDINGKVYFGELTFYHWSGMVPFEPDKWDEVFGKWIKLPGKEVIA